VPSDPERCRVSLEQAFPPERAAMLRLNNFGGTIGGPVVIPRVYNGHNKTFFFFDYDGIREASGFPTVSGVPDQAEREGDFSELCTRAGGTFNASGMCSAAAGQLWDPYTGVYNSSLGGPVRSGFIPDNNMLIYHSPGNPILNGTGLQLPPGPGNLIDPAAAKYMTYFPLPNYNVGTPAYNPYTNWAAAPVEITNNDQFDIKIDQQFGDRDVLSGRYSQSKETQPPFPCYSNTDPADPCTAGTYISTSHEAAINYSHIFSPTLLLTTTLGITRGFYNQEGAWNEPQFKGKDPWVELGTPSYMDRSDLPEWPWLLDTLETVGQGPARIP
jgi:hypothetical protein